MQIPWCQVLIGSTASEIKFCYSWPRRSLNNCIRYKEVVTMKTVQEVHEILMRDGPLETD